MNPRWLRVFANALVGLSGLDAALSLLEELLRATTGALWLMAPRSALAQVVLLGVFASLLLMLFTPRLPLAVFLPLAIGTLWLSFGAAPLALWIESPTALAVTCCALQLAITAVACWVIRRRNGGRGWLFDAESPAAPAFAWRRTLGLGTAYLVMGPTSALLYFVVAIATWTQLVTHGFVQFDLEGVSLADRRYEREGQEIRLVGMMHIGEEQAYRALVRTFARESTVVLAEGVSDRESRLSGQLQYGRAAQVLGLSPQQELRSYLIDPDDPEAELSEWPVVRHADVDASELSPQTIEWIEWAGAIWQAEDAPSALLALANGIRQRGPDDLAVFQAEILDLRNARLSAAIDAALGEYQRVIVPWGALHLPAVENVVLAWGFEETSRERHALISWRTIAAAVF